LLENFTAFLPVPTPMESKKEKQAKRLMKNRERAREARERKRTIMQNLEQRVADLELQNEEHLEEKEVNVDTFSITEPRQELKEESKEQENPTETVVEELIPEPQPERYPEHMLTLRDMGFEDLALNRHLLANYQGDITKVISALLKVTGYRNN
jgi:hypothetical protein